MKDHKDWSEAKKQRMRDLMARAAANSLLILPLDEYNSYEDSDKMDDYTPVDEED
jgi:hypothetical protein